MKPTPRQAAVIQRGRAALGILAAVAVARMPERQRDRLVTQVRQVIDAYDRSLRRKRKLTLREMNIDS